MQISSVSNVKFGAAPNVNVKEVSSALKASAEALEAAVKTTTASLGLYDNFASRVKKEVPKTIAETLEGKISGLTKQIAEDAVKTKNLVKGSLFISGGAALASLGAVFSKNKN